MKKIKKESLDDVQEVDARVFFMPILESLSQKVLKEAVIEMKNDLYGREYGLDPEEEIDE